MGIVTCAVYKLCTFFTLRGKLLTLEMSSCAYSPIFPDGSRNTTLKDVVIKKFGSDPIH